MPPTEDLAHSPGMRLDHELNQRPFGSLAGAQTTDPHQPGLPHTSDSEFSKSEKHLVYKTKA